MLHIEVDLFESLNGIFQVKYERVQVGRALNEQISSDHCHCQWLSEVKLGSERSNKRACL